MTVVCALPQDSCSGVFFSDSASGISSVVVPKSLIIIIILHNIDRNLIGSFSSPGRLTGLLAASRWDLHRLYLIRNVRFQHFLQTLPLLWRPTKRRLHFPHHCLQLVKRLVVWQTDCKTHDLFPRELVEKEDRKILNQMFRYFQRRWFHINHETLTGVASHRETREKRRRG